MRTRYKTANGSVYIIDTTLNTWERYQQTERSGLLRSGWGPVTAYICAGEGYPLIIQGPPINPEADYRQITTSPVVTISEVEL